MLEGARPAAKVEKSFRHQQKAGVGTIFNGLIFTEPRFVHVLLLAPHTWTISTINQPSFA